MDQFLFFIIGTSLFAIERIEVREVARLKDFTLFPLPLSAPACLGLIHHHGRIAPLLKTEFWLSDSPIEASYPQNTAYIIFTETPYGEVGFLVDSISHDPQDLTAHGAWQFVKLNEVLGGHSEARP